jgi:hypothetical protein
MNGIRFATATAVTRRNVTARISVTTAPAGRKVNPPPAAGCGREMTFTGSCITR